MTEIRLPAKLARPRAAGAVERLRLFALLDAQHDCSLVWIFGPPGSGKTNLITTYLDHNKCPTLWFRIDEGDRDAATFFSYLGEAAATFKGKRGKNLPRLTPEYLLDIAGFSRRYFRELFASLPPGCALVLDNFESAGNALDKFLAIAALEVPPGMRLLVTSRTAPGDALNHLTAKGVLGQLSWDDLRLTPEEASAIQEKSRARLTDSVESLHAMCDGWVAGFVVMLGHGHETGLANPKTVGAVRESLFAYFIKEMFERADAPTRELLLKTAIMPSFSLAQATSLCSHTDGHGVLVQLTRHNFFIDLSLDAEPVYRYHGLFRDFLLAQGKNFFTPAQRHKLLVQAARLLGSAGQSDEALVLLQEAQAWQKAGELLCKIAPLWLRQGRVLALDSVISALPGATRDDMPWLVYWQGMARRLLKPGAGRALMEAAFHGFKARGEEKAALLACGGILDSYFLEWNDMHPVDRWGAEFGDLAEKLDAFSYRPNELPAVASLGVLWLRADLHAGLLAKARRWALAVIDESPDATQRMIAANFIGLQLCASADFALLGRMISTLESGLVAAKVPPVIYILWLLLKTWPAHQSGDTAQALVLIRQAEGIAKDKGLQVLDMLIAGHGIYPALNAGDLALADDYAHKMHSVLHPARKLDAANHDWVKSAIALARGDTTAAMTDALACLEKSEACGGNLPVAQCRILLAYIELEVAHPDAALTQADLVLVYARASGQRAFEHAALMIRSLALARLGAHEAATQELRNALAMGRASELVVIYPWSPTPFLQAVYALALDAGIEEAYVQNIIRRLKISAPAAAGHRWPWPVKIYTLGRFEIFIDDALLEFSRKMPKRPLALLKLLIANRGHLQVGTAIDTFWPDEDADAAMSSMDVALHRLRKMLGGPATIGLQDGRLSLDSRSIWVDALAMDDALDRVEAGAADASRMRLSVLGDYRGHFLPADLAEPWAAPARERWRSRFNRACAAYGREMEDVGNFEAAAAHYTRAIDLDPSFEASYQGLMRCHSARGWRSEGIATYERLRLTLLHHDGLKPSAASDQLLQHLKHPDNQYRAPGGKLLPDRRTVT